MTYKLLPPNKQVRRIRPGDPDFIITDDWAQYPRASIEITKSCPKEYIELIHEAHRKGWIKLSAVMYNHEYMWEKLSR